jgi:three-Cys-motif partner protein
VVAKPYKWAEGAALDDHTKRKHKILREYFFQYITVRCQNPKQERFRLAVVDGFAGAGRYACGSSGSPLIIIEELRNALSAVNLQRASQGLGTVEIDCLLVFNDASRDAIEFLKGHCEPLVAEIKMNTLKLHLSVHYMTGAFESSYPAIKHLVTSSRYRSVIYNLDQCGHSKVDKNTLIDIMRSTPSVEIFYTFAIESLLSFLSKTNPDLLDRQLRRLGIDGRTKISGIKGGLSNTEWLGTAEKLVFEAFKGCASFVSPFSINNPEGWRYWLIHFANNYRARQVYNNVLHDNSSSQAHFGRSGLNMLAYDPDHEAGSLYLFDTTARTGAKAQLLEDIPRLIAESGDVIGVSEFYECIYNATPAHTDDIHAALIDNDDLNVITPTGGERRKANTIGISDTIKLKTQRSLFPILLDASKPPGTRLRTRKSD